MSTPNGPYDPYGQQGQPGQPGQYGQQPMGQYQGYGTPYPPPGPDGYLRGGPVGFGDAIRLAFKNSFVYQGRASRSAYWWFALFSAIIGFAVDMVIGVATGISGHTHGVSAASVAPLYFVGLAMLVVTLPLAVRRMHDIDKSGWWLLLSLVPFFGAIVVFVFTLLDGTRGPNRFG